MVSHGTSTENQLNTPYPPTPEDQPPPEDQPTAEDQRIAGDQPTVDDQPVADDRPRAEDQPVAGERVGADDRATADERVGTAEEEPVELSPVSTTAGDAPLFSPDDTANFQVEWRALQSEFVDDPREAVQRADELVTQVMQALTDTFAEHKHALEEQWREGEQVQTEELRQALKRYRTFFDRLLSV